MKAISLEAVKREITGKKVRVLRKEGLVPVGVYGKDVKSLSLSVKAKEFEKVYSKVGETGLVDLKFEGKSLAVLVKNVQIHPLSRKILHAELHAVKLTEKIKAKVPVELVGESPAVQNNLGVLLQTLNEIEVEALPTDLPEKIEVDVSALAEIDQQVTVAELRAVKGVEILTNSGELVVKVAPAVSEETAKELAAEEAVKAAEAPAQETGREVAEREATAQKPEKLLQ